MNKINQIYTLYICIDDLDKNKKYDPMNKSIQSAPDLSQANQNMYVYVYLLHNNTHKLQAQTILKLPEYSYIEKTNTHPV